MPVAHVRQGHSHVYSGDVENKVRRVRCQHSSSNQVNTITRVKVDSFVTEMKGPRSGSKIYVNI